MTTRRTVETSHGAVDAGALQELKASSITSDLIAAIDALDANEGREKWLRACLVRLHAMASHLIDGAPKTVTGRQPIWQLAEEIADEIDAQAANLSHITRVVDQLGRRLRPGDGSMPGSSP